MLSPFINTTSRIIFYTLFNIEDNNQVFLIIIWISEKKFSVAPYLSNNLINSLWPEVSKALTRSAKATKVDKLWLFIIFNIFLIVKRPFLQPILGVPKIWHFVPWSYNTSKQLIFMKKWISWTWRPLTSLLSSCLDLTSLLTSVLEHIDFMLTFEVRYVMPTVIDEFKYISSTIFVHGFECFLRHTIQYWWFNTLTTIDWPIKFVPRYRVIKMPHFCCLIRSSTLKYVGWWLLDTFLKWGRINLILSLSFFYIVPSYFFKVVLFVFLWW